jgi:hypothetical protein
MAAISAGSQWVRLAMSRFLTLPSWRKDSEVDGLVGFAVGGGPERAGYVHVHIIQHSMPIINRQFRLSSEIMHVYIFQAKTNLTASARIVYLKLSG